MDVYGPETLSASKQLVRRPTKDPGHEHFKDGFPSEHTIPQQGRLKAGMDFGGSAVFRVY